MTDYPSPVENKKSFAKKSKRDRYRSLNGKKCIEVSIKNSQQLFDARDPAPFIERDLDDNFADYINTSNKEIPLRSPTRLIIYIKEPRTDAIDDQGIIAAIRSYYLHIENKQETSLYQFVRRAQLFLVLGFMVLFGGLYGSHFLQSQFSSDWIKILSEGLVIISWVSMWKPIELILFDWFPLYEELKYTRKICQMEIDIQT